MELHHQFQSALTFASIKPFIQIQVYKFGMIMQCSSLEGFDKHLSI